jgi:hypothetical protein
MGRSLQRHRAMRQRMHTPARSRVVNLSVALGLAVAVACCTEEAGLCEYSPSVSETLAVIAACGVEIRVHPASVSRGFEATPTPTPLTAPTLALTDAESRFTAEVYGTTLRVVDPETGATLGHTSIPRGPRYGLVFGDDLALGYTVSVFGAIESRLLLVSLANPREPSPVALWETTSRLHGVFQGDWPGSALKSSAYAS